MRQLRYAAEVVVAASTFAMASSYAAYPEKPIRIVVAYTPAGATDILARTVGQKLMYNKNSRSEGSISSS